MLELEPGDLVRLKSGGPLMTIESVENNVALCSWFYQNDEGHWFDYGSSHFRTIVLELSEKEL